VSGVLPSQDIAALLEDGTIHGSPGGDRVQPASLDLSVAEEAYAVPGSMLPLPGESISSLVRGYARRRLDLSQPTVLVRGETYVVRLRERLRLTPDLSAYANSKSSTGRIDLQTRLLTDATPRYDKVRAGYEGPLWLELIPKSFDIVLRADDSLNQAIFFRERAVCSRRELEAVHEHCPVLRTPCGEPIGPDAWLASEGLLMTINLELPTVGYVAKRSFRPIDLRRRDHDPSEYFDPVCSPKSGVLFLTREAFYILSTYEYLSIPPEYAVEMLPYDTSAGEFRAHYAGFFDPGFGYGDRGQLVGTPAVLEVRPYEDDLILRHRQPVCMMAYERMVALPERVYGTLGSHYGTQRGPALSKYFAAP